MADNSKFEHDTVADTGVSALVCGPGEVPVKVDDLYLDGWAQMDESGWQDPTVRTIIRAAKAKAAHIDQQAEQPAEADDEWKVGDQASDRVGDTWQLREDGWCCRPDGARGPRCDGDHSYHGLTTETFMEAHGPITRVTDDEQPTPTPDTTRETEAQHEPETASVSLPCPECGETIMRQVRAVRVKNARATKWYLEFLPVPGAVGTRAHACKPKEPTGFGAVVEIAFNGGGTDLAVRADGDYLCWRKKSGGWNSWDGLHFDGTITVLSEGVSK